MKIITRCFVALLIAFSFSCRKGSNPKKMEDKIIGKWLLINVTGTDGIDYTSHYKPEGVNDLHFEFVESPQKIWTIEYTYFNGSSAIGHASEWELQKIRKSQMETEDYIYLRQNVDLSNSTFLYTGFSDDGSILEYIDKNHIKLFVDDGVKYNLERVE
ncbi:MAG: hypothetical protein MRY83_05790 [Flavobacteriales bacterium]|nr:hypothetical protein [Flavobacteriales bacterium]